MNPEFKVGDIWLTKDGAEFEILSLNGYKKHPIIGKELKFDDKDNGLICSWKNNGEIYHGTSCWNLISKKKKKVKVKVERWINVYRKNKDDLFCRYYDKEILAKAACESNEYYKLIAGPIPFVWEGEIDEEETEK